MFRFLFNAPPPPQHPPTSFSAVLALNIFSSDYRTTTVLFVYSSSIVSVFSGIHWSLPPVLYVVLFGAVVLPLACTEIKEQALSQNGARVSRTVRSETTLLLRQDPQAFTVVLAEAASDNLQQCPAGVCYQRYVPVVAVLCSILLFVEYHDDGHISTVAAPRPPTKYERPYRAVSGAEWDYC